MALNNPIPAWRGWTPAERESFFDAIARHQRAAWRVTLASTFANAVMAVAVAVLTGPLFYSVLLLSLDLTNLFTPTPNLVEAIVRVIDPILDSPTTPSVRDWLRFIVFAAFPGLIWMGCVLFALRRMLHLSGMFDSGELPVRAPNPRVLAEQRLANVIAEMSIAANLPAPRVLIAARATLNAAVFGHDPAHATIVIAEKLLTRLNRDELQGIAAYLIGSIANGDMRTGLRAALTMGLFGVFGRISTALNPGNRSGRVFLRLLRALSFPTAAGARALADELADPFAEPESSADSSPSASIRSRHASAGNTTSANAGRIARYIEILKFVLAAMVMGPVVLAGFFGGVMGSFVLGPLLALAWRQRKYMADATAVRLTRDPDTLGAALEKLAAAGGGRATLAPSVAHLSVVQMGSAPGLFGGGVVPMYPSLDRRLRALAALGAHLDREPSRMPLRHVLIAAPLIGILCIVITILVPLLAYLSLAVSLFFTAMPVSLLHVILRALASWLRAG